MLSKISCYRKKTVFLSLVAFLIILANIFVNLPNVYLNALEQPNLKYVIVHLDLKGSPPKLEYLTKLLPMLKRNGVNGLLMEYEDMFPYEKELKILARENCYDKTELRNFLKTASDMGFEIIPLIQTFGHMEFVLKHSQFNMLSEDPFSYNSICPSNASSIELIKNMLRQVIEFHQNDGLNIKYIHIGCDEVYNMNKCPLCLARKLDNIQIFESHIENISKFIEKLVPGLDILIWDDMLRGDKRPEHKNLTVQPVAWYYHDIPPIHFDLFQYHKRFGKVWAASAFKGAESKSSIVPNLELRLQNHFDWMMLLQTYIKAYPHMPSYGRFEGILLTGWSRYNHLQPLCDLLPASIPSLISNLILIKYFLNSDTEHEIPKDTKVLKFAEAKLIKEISDELICNNVKKLKDISGNKCKFDDKTLYNDMKFIENMTKTDKRLLKKISQQQNMTETRFDGNVQPNLNNIISKVYYDMTPYFDQNTIDEFIESYLK